MFGAGPGASSGRVAVPYDPRSRRTDQQPGLQPRWYSAGGRRPRCLRQGLGHHDGIEAISLDDIGAMCPDVTFSPDGRCLAAAEGGAVRTSTVDDGPLSEAARIQRFPDGGKGHHVPVESLMRSSDDGFSHLMQRARDGDRLAIEQLVRLYEAEVRMIAPATGLGAPLRPYLDTVDLVQSVHRSLLTGLRHDKFDISTPDKLVALALTIVRRKTAGR